MKPRRVIVTLEVETDATLNDLKNIWRWRASWNKYNAPANDVGDIVVNQASANVVERKQKKEKKK